MLLGSAVCSTAGCTRLVQSCRKVACLPAVTCSMHLDLLVASGRIWGGKSGARSGGDSFDGSFSRGFGHLGLDGRLGLGDFGRHAGCCRVVWVAASQKGKAMADTGKRELGGRKEGVVFVGTSGESLSPASFGAHPETGWRPHPPCQGCLSVDWLPLSGTALNPASFHHGVKCRTYSRHLQRLIF